jgi:hypothetical protein
MKYFCREKDRLLEIRLKVANEYTGAVNRLNQCPEGKDVSQFRVLYHIAEEVRLRAESARIDYERHVAEHGC